MRVVVVGQVRVAHLLAAMGADVRAADPHVVEASRADGPVRRVEASAEELSSADAVVLIPTTTSSTSTRRSGTHDPFSIAGIAREVLVSSTYDENRLHPEMSTASVMSCVRTGLSVDARRQRLRES